MDGQRPASKPCVLEPRNRSLGFRGVGLFYKPHAWLLVAVLLLEQMDAGHYPIRAKELAEVGCRRGLREIADKNVHRRSSVLRESNNRLPFLYRVDSAQADASAKRSVAQSQR